MKPRFHGLVLWIVIHSQNLEATRLKARIRGLLIRQFATTRPAPQRPKIQQHVLAAKVSKLALFSVKVRKRKVWKFSTNSQLNALIVRSGVFTHYNLVLLDIDSLR